MYLDEKKTTNLLSMTRMNDSKKRELKNLHKTYLTIVEAKIVKIYRFSGL